MMYSSTEPRKRDDEQHGCLAVISQSVSDRHMCLYVSSNCCCVVHACTPVCVCVCVCVCVHCFVQFCLAVC